MKSFLLKLLIGLKSGSEQIDKAGTITMKRRKNWRKLVAIVMAVVMLPFSSLENCFVDTAYAAEASGVSDFLEKFLIFWKIVMHRVVMIQKILRHLK